MKKFIYAATALTVLSIVSVSPLTANANTTESSNSRENVTRGKVGFTEGYDDRIFHPESKDIQGTNPEFTVVLPDTGVVGNHGTDAKRPPIRLAYTPDFDFGVHRLSAKHEVVPARALKAKVTEFATEGDEFKITSEADKWIQNFVQVTDLRGSLEGWQLSVKMSKPFTSKDTTGEVIKGAEIRFTDGQVHTVTPDGNEKAVVGTAAFNLGEGTDSVVILDAQKTAGGGFHGLHWGKEAQVDVEHKDVLGDKFEIVGTKETSPIKLFIPANSAKAMEYEADLTWTLVAGPDNSNTMQP